jgi:hypothetical protein
MLRRPCTPSRTWWRSPPTSTGESRKWAASWGPRADQYICHKEFLLNMRQNRLKNGYTVFLNSPWSSNPSLCQMEATSRLNPREYPLGLLRAFPINLSRGQVSIHNFTVICHVCRVGPVLLSFLVPKAENLTLTFHDWTEVSRRITQRKTLLNS